MNGPHSAVRPGLGKNLVDAAGQRPIAAPGGEAAGAGVAEPEGGENPGAARFEIPVRIGRPPRQIAQQLDHDRTQGGDLVRFPLPPPPHSGSSSASPHPAIIGWGRPDGDRETVAYLRPHIDKATELFGVDAVAVALGAFLLGALLGAGGPARTRRVLAGLAAAVEVGRR